mgnify:CR=1 FL=1
MVIKTKQRAAPKPNGGGKAAKSGGCRRRGPRQDNRRALLLDAAARQFGGRGYHAVTMREIAAGADMLAGSVYYHFPSKDDLLIAVYEEGVRRLADRVEAAVADIDDPWNRLTAACRAHANMLLDDSDYAQVILSVHPADVPPGQDRLIALRDAYEEQFRTMIEALPLPPGTNRAALRFTLLGALNWSKNWYRPGAMTPAQISREILDILRCRLAEPATGTDLPEPGG